MSCTRSTSDSMQLVKCVIETLECEEPRCPRSVPHATLLRRMSQSRARHATTLIWFAARAHAHHNRPIIMITKITREIHHALRIRVRIVKVQPINYTFTKFLGRNCSGRSRKMIYRKRPKGVNYYFNWPFCLWGSWRYGNSNGRKRTLHFSTSQFKWKVFPQYVISIGIDGV